MRLLFLVISFIFAGNLIAQDTLVFKDGYIWLCEIQSVKGKSIVFTRYDDKEESVDARQLMEYSRDGQWYKWNGEDHDLLSGPKNNFKLSVFLRKPKNKYGRFSLGINLTAPLAHVDVDKTYPGYYWQDQSNANLFPQTNRSITVEPEYRIFDRFSVKLPVMIGLDFSTPDTLFQSVNPDPYYYYGSSFVNWSAPYQVTTTDVNDIDFYSGYNRNLNGHAKNVIFQVGVAPKIYPFGQTKIAWYLGAGAYGGLMDQYRIDYFLDLTTDVDQWGDLRWMETNEYAVRYSEPKPFFRFEAMMGVDLNFSQFINLGFEGAWSSNFYTTKPKDQVFARHDNDPYSFVAEFDYRYTGTRWGYPVGRVYLIIRIPELNSNE